MKTWEIKGTDSNGLNFEEVLEADYAYVHGIGYLKLYNAVTGAAKSETVAYFAANRWDSCIEVVEEEDEITLGEDTPEGFVIAPRWWTEPMTYRDRYGSTTVTGSISSR